MRADVEFFYPSYPAFEIRGLIELINQEVIYEIYFRNIHPH